MNQSDFDFFRDLLVIKRDNDIQAFHKLLIDTREHSKRCILHTLLLPGSLEALRWLPYTSIEKNWYALLKDLGMDEDYLKREYWLMNERSYKITGLSDFARGLPWEERIYYADHLHPNAFRGNKEVYESIRPRDDPDFICCGKYPPEYVYKYIASHHQLKMIGGYEEAKHFPYVEGCPRMDHSPALRILKERHPGLASSIRDAFDNNLVWYLLYRGPIHLCFCRAPSKRKPQWNLDELMEVGCDPDHRNQFGLSYNDVLDVIEDLCQVLERR